MPDYGQELRFGIFPTPDADAVDQVVELAEAADVAGLDYVTIQDHPYNARQVDAWTLLSFIGARTSSIRLAPNVANLPLRPPVVLGRSVATLDRLTGGRAELGIGTGAFWDAIAAAGGPRRSPGEAMRALEEAIQVLRGVWSGSGSVTVDGDHYRVKGLHAGPAPVHPVEIWVGAYKPRMLRLTGRLADGWLPSMGYADPPALGALSEQLDAAALEAGRDPAPIRRLYNVFGLGAEALAELALEQGMSTFITGVRSVRDVQRFAQEIAPATRELVDAERARRATQSDEATTRHTVTTAAPPEPHAGSGAHLVEVHDGLRAELGQLRDIVQQVMAGEEQAHRARNAINELTMRQNNWTLGAYCAQYCRFVTGHHTLEDRSIFPHLRRSDPALTPVLDRLEQEHVVIHDILEQLDDALVGLVSGASGTAELQRVVDTLNDDLLAHLAYEEEQLVTALDKYGFQ